MIDLWELVGEFEMFDWLIVGFDEFLKSFVSLFKSFFFSVGKIGGLKFELVVFVGILVEGERLKLLIFLLLKVVFF